MLSYHDLGKELGKNIYVYPLKENNVKGNTIDFTASTFAFSPDGVCLYDEEKKKIVIPKHTTACIITNEALYLSGKIGGSCHSRVRLTQKGIGHLGTTLDPFYCGQLLVILHNTTENQILIDENERIISLMFYYLKSPIFEDTHTWAPTHLDKITGVTKDEYRKWLEANPWANGKDILISNCINSKEYREFKKNYKRKIRRSGTFSEKVGIFFKHHKKIILCFIVMAIIYGLLDFFMFSKMTDANNYRTEYFIAVGIFILGLFIGKNE